MKILNVQDIEAQIASILAEIEKKGEHFVIYRNGKPIAEIIPHRRKGRLPAPPKADQIAFNYEASPAARRDE